ncbi:MAG: ABC transporter ATP-binding protein [Mycoplasmataceae bacterium]|jgi:simple sugar transport system ATP-binding protein|nr:ABC transporter ATP-binding protein [Mycoplasmataceae bacterium]
MVVLHHNNKFLKNHIKENYGKTKFAVEMYDINKTFANGSIIANENITLKVKTNTIHAIIGENGAGKSTLMSILFGIYQSDKGYIKINGENVNFNSAQDATKVGLGMVHQHFKLVQVFTLLENIVLGAEITNRFGLLNNHHAETKIQKLACKYNLKVDLHKKVSQVSVGQQQRVEILKLLYRDSDILIFDEPTAVLSDTEIKSFLKMLLQFKKQGKTIIIITHKLNEIKEVADEATVIRLGRKIAEFNISKTSISTMANAMVGHQLKEEYNSMLTYKFNQKPIVLQVDNLHAHRISTNKVEALKGISFKVHAGQILGIAGVEGNGQTELALAIGGLLKPISGDIKLVDAAQNNKTHYLNHLTVKEIYKLGISHIPEDRHKYGLLLDETVAFNCVTPQIDEKPFSRFGFLNKKAISQYANNICVKFDVRGSHSGKSLARSLSGGNQQKLVFGREISRPHKLIIYVQPTRGLDIGAIQSVHRHIVEDAKKGAAVILISYELDEIFKITSDIMIMSHGHVVYYGSTQYTTRSMVGHYIGNHKHASG